MSTKTTEARYDEALRVMDEMSEIGRWDLYDLAYAEYARCADLLEGEARP